MARILVVEDTADSGEPLVRLLRHSGHRVHWSRDGQQALEALDEFEPDVALLDLMMPVMDGYEFLGHLRTTARWSHLNVTVITAAGPSLDWFRLKQFGVQDVLMKGALDYHGLLNRLAAIPAT